jgi:hypothetical protein
MEQPDGESEALRDARSRSEQTEFEKMLAAFASEALMDETESEERFFLFLYMVVAALKVDPRFHKRSLRT